MPKSEKQGNRGLEIKNKFVLKNAWHVYLLMEWISTEGKRRAQKGKAAS